MKRSDNTCSICTYNIEKPYRKYGNNGQIIEGCVDPCHDPYLPKYSNTWNWAMKNRKHKK